IVLVVQRGGEVGLRRGIVRGGDVGGGHGRGVGVGLHHTQDSPQVEHHSFGGGVVVGLAVLPFVLVEVVDPYIQHVALLDAEGGVGQIVPAAQVDDLALVLVFAALRSAAAVHPQEDGHIVLAVLAGLALGVGDGAARQQVSDLVFDNHDVSSLSV